MTTNNSPLFSGYAADRVVIVFACQDKDQLHKIKQVPLSRGQVADWSQVRRPAAGRIGRCMSTRCRASGITTLSVLLLSLTGGNVSVPARHNVPALDPVGLEMVQPPGPELSQFDEVPVRVTYRRDL